MYNIITIIEHNTWGFKNSKEFSVNYTEKCYIIIVQHKIIMSCEYLEFKFNLLRYSVSKFVFNAFI